MADTNEKTSAPGASGAASGNASGPAPGPTPGPTHDAARLVARLMELDDMLVSCMRCGMCQAVCPVYNTTMREADVTRGKIALLENLAHSMISDAGSVNDKLNRCLLCGSCQANCPSGVKIMDIFLRARAIVAEYMGYSPLKKLIFRGLLTHPGLFNTLLDIGGKFQGLFIKEADPNIGTSCSTLMQPFIGDRHFAALAKESLHSKVASLDTPAGKSGLRVAFFPGCVTDKLFPGVGEATLKVLEKHGVGVFMPEKQACCGIPALASGDRAAYDKLVRLNLERFAGADFDYFITPCATCGATIKEIWPKLMDAYTPAEKTQIQRLHDKTIDITAFLVDVLKVDVHKAVEQAGSGAAKPVRVTYHDSCHLKKSLGVAEQPREILRGLPGYELAEMADADKCCGCGGSFTLNHYDLSKAIGQRKRDNIVAVHPQVVATGCPACMMQIMDMLSRNGDEITVRHVIELYADTL